MADLPEGSQAKWKLVLLEPTEEMIAEGAHAGSEWLDDDAPLNERRYREPARSIYRDMVAASPAPEPLTDTEIDEVVAVHGEVTHDEMVRFTQDDLHACIRAAISAQAAKGPR